MLDNPTRRDGLVIMAINPKYLADHDFCALTLGIFIQFI
jgi:hypothetical protein